MSIMVAWIAVDTAWERASAEMAMKSESPHTFVIIMNPQNTSTRGPLTKGTWGSGEGG